jgi:REP element-mobilizing transposase RayT
MAQASETGLSYTGSAGVPPAPKPEWHSRGYLPHRDKTGLIQALTFRLADSLPSDALKRIESELLHTPVVHRDAERARSLAAWLDEGHGACELARPEIATLVENALLHFDGERYRLIAWCVMPNHVHTLVESNEGHALADIVHSWKSYTAKAANRLLARTGDFWQREYHDRYIRDAQHLAAAISYIDENPVKAGLVNTPQDWPFGSARRQTSRTGNSETGSAGVPPAP